MPKRDCLTSNLLKVMPLRNAVSIAALYNLVALYFKEKEIMVQLGLELKKCSCLVVAGI